MGAFLRSGALGEIIDQMISQTALGVFGRDQGLVASKRMVDGEIASIPAFQNLAGQFDENAFRAPLARENVSEATLRNERSDEHTSELQSLMRTSYAVFCLQKKH